MTLPKLPSYQVKLRAHQTARQTLVQTYYLLLNGRECRLTPVPGGRRGTLTLQDPWPTSGGALTLVATLTAPSSRRAGQSQFILNVTSETTHPDGATHLTVTWTADADLILAQLEGEVFLKASPLETL